MIKTIYVPQIQQAKEFLEQENWETQYSISSQASPKVKSQNRILLYALCLHLFQEISRDHYIQIDNSNFLEIRDEDRQKAIYFMNRAVSKSLPQITHFLEGKLLMHYLREQNKIYDIKMLLIIEQNLDTTTPLKNQKLFAVIYFHYQQTESIIENFRIHKIPINDELIRRKIQFLGLNNQDALNQSTMAIWEEKRVNHKIIQYFEETRNQTSSIMVSDEHDESKLSSHMSSIHIAFQYLVIYGDRKSVQKLMFIISQSFESIKHRNFQRGDPLFNNFMFAIKKVTAENYQKCRVFEINKGNLLQVLYHSSIQNIFDEKLMKYSKYKITKLNNVRLVLRQPSIMEARDTIPSLISYTDKNQGELVIGEIELINHLQMMNENIKQSRKTEKNLKEDGKQKLKSGKQQEQKKISQKQKLKIDFMNNLEINESNYKEVLEKCEQFKMQQFMTYKIDISENIRITNRIKNCNIIYVVFETVVELLQLQTVIDEPISLTELNKVIKEYEEAFYQNPKSLHIQSAKLTLKLYPLPYEIMDNNEKYYKELLQTIKNDTVIFKTLLCSLKTFKVIMRTCLIDSNYIFVLNQMTPLIECDEQFEKQTQHNRIRTGKQQLQYYYQIKTDINNVDYISAANFKKEETFLKEVMCKDIHQYEIGEYILNEADEYNISYMIGQGLQNMFFILSSTPKQEYIYFTYFQKLVKVIRDSTGKFKQIQDASMSKDISRNNQQLIRPAINRAFLTGQKFISINIPIDHVKSVSLNNITRLSTGNHNLVRYFLRKLASSQRYKICVKAPYNTEYFSKEFAKQYILKFDNQKIRKQIKSLDLGYGNINKWREKPFVCMRADHFICKKILDKFQEGYGTQLAKQKK